MSLKRFLPTVLLAASPLAICGQALAMQAETEAPAVEPAPSDEPAIESDEPISELEEWESLDAQLRGLTVLDVENEPMAELWGYASATTFHQKDGNRQGVSLDYVRLNLSGKVSSFTYRLTTDIASGSARLEDIWASTPLIGPVHFTIGQFKTPFLRSGLIEARDLLFISRTRNGVFYSQRNKGVMLNAEHGRFHWALALQNGISSENNRTQTTVHASVDLLSQDRLPWEGAFNSGDKTRLTLGAGFSQDHVKKHGAAISTEANLVHKRYSFSAEYLHFGSAYSHPELPPEVIAEQRGSTSPWSLTASYMIVPDKFEVAVRYDDFDDNSATNNLDRKTVSIGINRYLQGHDIKWQLNYAYSHKGGIVDGNHDPVIGLGLTASF